MKVDLKLFAVQQALKAPKDQFNGFGKYHYRSCEGILEALKPHLGLNQLILTLNDEVVSGGDRVYIKATATVTDIEEGGSISCSAFAREEETKKGMDASQVTGAASSYARKYALNGLFAIDDNKDSDATNDGAKNATTEKTAVNRTNSASSEKSAKTTPHFECVNCGAVLKPYEFNGKTIPIRQHAEKSQAQYGKVLCLDCINKMKGETNA